MRHEIVKAAEAAYRQFWRATSDESEGDKQATAVTKEWQRIVASDYVRCEEHIKDNLKERIDVIDLSIATAYEMKVSGKNADHEFYKDIFKALIYNQSHDKKLVHLVFITEKAAVDKLSKGLGKEVLVLARQFNLNVTLEEI